MTIHPGCAQHIGSRSEQQDSFAFSHIEDSALVKRVGVLAVVADGMGGLAMGQESATATVKTVLAVHEAGFPTDSTTEILRQAVIAANEEVLSLARGAHVEGEAGSTLVAVVVKEQLLSWVSVGDSRIYLYRTGELTQLNREQNFAAELMRRVAVGEISRDDAEQHPDRAGLTNFIGNPDLKPADASLRPFPLKDGDWIILCSDGLFGVLDDEELREELYGAPNDACTRVVNLVMAQKRSNQDNVTVAILGCGDREPVTVRTKKRPSPTMVTPLPVAKTWKRPVVLLGLAVVFVLVGGVSLFTGKHLLIKKTHNPVMSKHSSSVAQKQTTSVTKPNQKNKTKPVNPKIKAVEETKI